MDLSSRPLGRLLSCISLAPVLALSQGTDDSGATSSNGNATSQSVVLNDETPVTTSTLDATVVESTPVRGRGTAPVPNRLVVADTLVDFATPVENDTLNRARIDNPISVAQFSGADLLLRGVTTDRREVLNRTANATSLPGGFGSFTIRGINDESLVTSFDTGSNNLATIFINQAPISKNHVAYLPPSLWDVETVEVLRGPQSVFQGPNSLAGALFYDYVDPNFSWEGRTRFEYGEYNTLNWAVTQNIPIADQYLAARFNYERNL
ncbi:MAG: TonB-dependent receptor plug domain-containing protein, partial [Verrucomicrobiota bacterium]